MQFYYGEKNLLRALDEAEFWKHQEAEHTTVIQVATPNLEIIYVEKLKKFEKEFNITYGKLVRYIQSVIRSKGDIDRELKVQILDCIRYSICQSKHFIEFLEMMLGQSKAVQKNIIAQTVINHIVRESQYFIGIEQLIL